MFRGGLLTIEVLSAESLPLCSDDKENGNASASKLRAFVEVKVDDEKKATSEVLENIMMSDASSPKWNEVLDEEIPLEPENKEISFIVKHEGDPEEDLADCVYQIPDLVAACRKDDGEPMGCRLQLQLQPKGVLNLHIALEEEVMDEADRIRMESMGEIHPVKGHRFAVEANWTRGSCAVCKEWVGGIVGTTDAYSCKECAMTVHKNCMNSVMLTCTGANVPYVEGDLNIQAGIPHSLEMYTFGTPTWCSHCSKLLWGFTNQGLKCTASNCDFACHKKCKQYAGNFCGMDPQLLAGSLSSNGERVKKDEVEKRKRLQTIKGFQTPTDG